MMLPSLQQAANSSSVLVLYETFQGMEQTNSSVIGEIEDGELIPEDRRECLDRCERNRQLKRQLGARTNYNPYHCPLSKCPSRPPILHPIPSKPPILHPVPSKPPILHPIPSRPPILHHWMQSHIQYDTRRIDDAIMMTAPWICLAQEESCQTNYNPYHCPPSKCPFGPSKLHHWTQSDMQYDTRIDDATTTMAPWIHLAREESRQVINAIKKIVEISNGNEDFP